MSYRTIVVHCNDVRRIDAVLAPAVALAERFKARLIGLSIVPPVLVLPAGMPGTPELGSGRHAMPSLSAGKLCIEGGVRDGGTGPQFAFGVA